MDVRRDQVAIPLSLHRFYILWSVFQYVIQIIFSTHKSFFFDIFPKDEPQH